MIKNIFKKIKIFIEKINNTKNPTFTNDELKFIFDNPKIIKNYIKYKKTKNSKIILK